MDVWIQNKQFLEGLCSLANHQKIEALIRQLRARGRETIQVFLGGADMKDS